MAHTFNNSRQLRVELLHIGVTANHAIERLIARFTHPGNFWGLKKIPTIFNFQSMKITSQMLLHEWITYVKFTFLCFENPFYIILKIHKKKKILKMYFVIILYLSIKIPTYNKSTRANNIAKWLLSILLPPDIDLI